MSAQAEFASAVLDPLARCPEDLRAWNGSDVAKRFAVYRNNLMVSLANALADSFPVVQELVGREFFRAMACEFVRSQPPRSPLLLTFGSAFPDFIDAFAPSRSVPYLADVARLELARVEAFHSSDMTEPAESNPPVRLHPAARVVRSRFPVYSIWAAHHGVGELETLDLTRAETALIVRPELDVLVVSMQFATATLLESLLRGQSLQDAVEAALHVPGFDLTDALAFLLHHRAITTNHFPPGDQP